MVKCQAISVVHAILEVYIIALCALEINKVLCVAVTTYTYSTWSLERLKKASCGMYGMSLFPRRRSCICDIPRNGLPSRELILLLAKSLMAKTCSKYKASESKLTVVGTYRTRISLHLLRSGRSVSLLDFKTLRTRALH